MMPPRLTPTFGLILILTLTLGLLTPLDSWAKKSRASGGYSRPASSLSQRTPTTRPSRASRTPSVSGGYSRPSSAATSSTARAAPSGSATDQALSRQASKRALDDFQRQRQAATATSSGSANYSNNANSSNHSSTSSTSSIWSGWTTRPSTARTAPPPRRPSTHSVNWYGHSPSNRYTLPKYYRGHTAPSFGPWSAVLLFGLLETLSSPGHAEFFYHHAEDPAYRQWRTEAEALAREHAELAQQLAALDQQLATFSGPRDTQYPAPNLAIETDDLATEPEPTMNTATTGFPFAALLTGLFMVLLLAVLLILIWRRFARPSTKARRSQHGAASRSGYRPDWFRLGMTLPLDPSLFILAAPWTQIQAPSAASNSGLLSVERLGTVSGAGVTWHRLYVADDERFFQVHCDAHGQPDECRYFAPLDVVEPTDAAEWGVWLDRDEGLIGWPEFETQDGHRYARLWSPGQTRIEPYALRETLETLNGVQAAPAQQQAMLYARTTGAAPPAPTTEYLLVMAQEQGDRAWVALHLGIDIPIASLNLS